MPHNGHVQDGVVYSGLIGGTVAQPIHIMPPSESVHTNNVPNYGSLLSNAGLSELREVELDKIFALNQLVENVNLSRRSLFESLSDATRNLEKECHLPESTWGASEYKNLYDSESLAARVVEVLPKQCFQVTPEVTENEDGDTQTEFEKAWEELGRSLLPNSGFINGDNLKGSKKRKKVPSPTGNAVPLKPTMDDSADTTNPTDTDAVDDNESDAMFAQEEGSPIWSYLLRADILSGIGQYGVIFFGIDDGLPFDQPAAGVDEQNSMGAEGLNGRDKKRPSDGGSVDGVQSQYTGTYDDRRLYPQYKRYTLNTNAVYNAKNLIKNRRLMYLRVLPESMADIVAFETNITSPRYGQPTLYKLTFNEYGRNGSSTTAPTGTYTVHWSRVQHIADWYHTADASEVLAKPRCEPVLKLLQSVKKPYYASAEGYFKMCMTILIGEFSTPDGTKPNVDLPGFKDMLWKLQNSLQRTGAMYNGELKSIAPTVADPTPFISVLIEAICIKLGCPIRIFKGSERGELASSQDDSQWNDEIRNRQNVYITPGIIIPFITRLVMLGVLPRPTGLRIKWPDMDSMTKAQQGTLAQTRTAAMAQYTQASIQDWFPPHEFLTRELGYDDDVAEAILTAGEEHAVDLQDKEMEKQQTMIDQGLAPDPQAVPEPNPVQMKPGTSLVHPQTGKTIAKGPPFPPKPAAKPVRNKKRRIPVATPVENVETDTTTDEIGMEPVVNATLGTFSKKLASWFWGK